VLTGSTLRARPADEKARLNRFLGEWLSHCLACGHEYAVVR